MDEFLEYIKRYAIANKKTVREAMKDALPWIVGRMLYGLPESMCAVDANGNLITVTSV